MISEYESQIASVNEGKKCLYKYFRNHDKAYQKSDIDIYNEFTKESGFKPIDSSVAKVLLEYVSMYRHTFSDKKLKTAFIKNWEEVEKYYANKRRKKESYCD